MGSVAAIVSAAQTGMQFSAQQNAAQAASQRGRFQQDIDNRNADLAEKQGSDAVNRGALAEDRASLETRQTIASSRAAAAAQGIDIGTGSAADVQTQQHEFGELDALTLRNNAAREAWGYDVEAANSRMQGRLAQLAGENEAGALRTESISTLLTGATNIYSAYRGSRTGTSVKAGTGRTVTAPAVNSRSGGSRY